MPSTLIAYAVMELAIDYVIAETVVYMAITFAVSTLASRFLTPNQNQGGSGTIGNTGARQQVPPDTTTPIPVVYGEAFLGGKFVDAALTVDQNLMFYVMAISCISENGTFTYDLNNIYYGDRKVAFGYAPDPAAVTSLTDTAGNVDTSIFTHLRIDVFTSDKNGNITNHIEPGRMPWDIMGSASGLVSSQQWSSTNRKMNGLAFAIIELGYSQTAQTTALQPITFHVKQSLNGSNVAKPGDVWVDFMTNPIYGAAVPLEYVDTASATALNNYSDELITFNDYNGNPQTQPRYRISGVLDPSQSTLSNIDQIMSACDSWQRYDAANGKWAVVINKAETATYSFNDSNLVGAITLGSIDITQMPNQVEARFPDSTNRDQYNYVNEKVPSYLLLPNEPVNKQTLNYDLVNNSVQALYLTNRVLEQGREDLLVTINTTYDGIQVNAGDVVTITNSYYGWTNKPFRAMQVKEAITPEGVLGAQIQLTEYNAAVYDNADITQYSPASNGNLSNPGYFSALSPPNPVNVQPYISVPSFDINVAIPVTGRVTYVILYYTTAASPTSTDWKVLDQQTLSDGQAFASGTSITFPHYTIPANTYYFAYVVGNEVAQSQLSPVTTAFVWNPDPANAASFVSTLSPVTLQVPFNGTSPTLTGINFRLYGSNGLGPVPFVLANDDSDPAFVPGSWRIGYNSNTGYATDIIQTGITFPLPPTDLGSYAQFGTATSMTASPATVQIPVRYKDLAGIVHLIPTSTMQAVYSIQGESAYQHNTAYLYQWSTTTPSNPSGTSIFNWSDGTSSSYTGSGGWDVAIPTNPGIPLIKLWQASKGVNDVATAITTTVDWTSGYQIADITQNGANGTQNATPTAYQWAVTIPSPPVGSSTYTWATDSYTPIPSGWTAEPGDPPSGGYTLWGASVSLVTSAGTATSTINWATASITARGYSGQSGGSARICYTKTTLPSLASSPTTITTAGNSSYPPNDSWGTGTVWQATAPSITAGESVYQSDGIYSPTTGNTVWNVPYLSALKVGALSAISANMGQITAGTITSSTFQTFATGQRLVLDYASNTFRAYTSLNQISVEIGSVSGEVYAKSYSVQPAILGVSTTPIPAVSAYNQYTGGSNDSANGLQATSYYGPALSGTGTYSGTAAHGLRAANQGVGGTSTSGLVGVANGYDFYAEGAGINYGPFTGAHDVLVPVGVDIEAGYICVDVKCILKKNLSNTVFEVSESTISNQVPIGVMVINNGLLANSKPAAFIEKYEYITKPDGQVIYEQIMYPEYDEYKNDYQYCGINAVGEGQVYVCGENGNITAGDLIVTSSIAGIGMKQSDDIVKNITVAKARESITFADTTTPVLVACIYLCG